MNIFLVILFGCKGIVVCLCIKIVIEKLFRFWKYWNKVNVEYNEF